MFSGFQDFDPRFAGALQRFIAASPGLQVNSGYRTPARQAQLWANAVQKYGSESAARRWVAPPGHSFHNMGLAADLGFTGEGSLGWAHAHAGDYGLAFPLRNENWHIELAGARGGGAPDYSGARMQLVQPTPGGTQGMQEAPFDIFGGRSPASGMTDIGGTGPGSYQAPPMTPERFLTGMIAGENPLRSMILGGIMRAIL
jgi:D-alanyl-D-alanine carboxypeptidase